MQQQLSKSPSHNAALALLESTTPMGNKRRHLSPKRDSLQPELVWPEPCIPPPKEFNHSTVDYLREILTAKVYDVSCESPLSFAPKLSQKLSSTIYLKREDLQPIFSFKCRGAFNKIASLDSHDRAAGIVCASAGNHAQGVALAANKLGIDSTIVMPKFAPEIKVDSVRRLGGKVVLVGNDFDEAKAECYRLQKEHSYTFIHPFDGKYFTHLDPKVIAGQGTVAMEIFKQIRQDNRIDAIFVCCGGGGLLAGIAFYVKRLYPTTRVIGVNTVDSDSMFQSLISGQVVNIPLAGLFSDGTSVRQVGAENHRICSSFVDDFVLVTTDEVCSGIRDAYAETRSILEPSGALAVAGIKKYLGANPSLRGGVYVAVTSGANMNFDRLRFVAERARLGDNKEILLCVQIPEKPGSFFQLYQTLQPRIVTEFAYRFNDPKQAAIYMAVEVLDTEQDRNTVIEILSQNDQSGPDANLYNCIDITENELAKAHTRFLVGGRSSAIDEVVIRFRYVLYTAFRFPERPGALIKFLAQLNQEKEWNVSMWHYRNNGGDFGRVLIGLQVPEKERVLLTRLLDKMGYQWTEETNNEAYTMFLR